MPQNDTICAIASTQGGAIGLIRISGPQAISITSHIFIPIAPATPLKEREPYTLTFGYIKNDQSEIVDEVLISLFHAPHSYTGEDTTEISCHGSSYILQQIMQLLITHGCRAACPGEYTQRAFLNGKMDLSQAEAVADLIASSSAATHRMAINQMKGGFSQKLKSLREQLLHFTSLIELELDFSDHEELEFADRSELKSLCNGIENEIKKLCQSFSLGNTIKNGIPVAIIGETNAGKSTLLNTLLNDERAIVSDIQGTTRDTIEDTINIDGLMFRFIDTAGIRETHDKIEAIGIKRSFKAIERANIILWIIDQTEAEKQIANLYSTIIPLCKDKQLILVLNKSDLNTSPTSIKSLDFPESTQVISLSAKQKKGIKQLQSLLIETAHLPALSSNDIIVTNVRHYEALTRALEAIHRVQENLSTNLSGDFISQDLRECIFHLSDIVGEVTTDDVLANIFSHFCIGK